MDGKNRIPRRYKHTPTMVSGIDEARKVRVRGTFLGTVDPKQTNKMTFYLPNRSDLPFVDMSSITLRGQIQVNAVSSVVAEAYDVIQPSVGGDYTNVSLIMDRTQTYIGSQLLEECLNQKLLSSMNIGLKTNPIWRLSQNPYANAGKWVVGQTGPVWRDFRIRLAFLNSELYGSDSEELTSQDFLIPVGMCPRIQLDVFFSDPQQVVSVVPTTTGVVSDVSYLLRNLELDCLYLKSRLLNQQLVSNPAWSITWTSHMFTDTQVQAGSLGKISINIPSSFAQASMLMIIFQRPIDDNNPKIANRVISCSSELSAVVASNCRVNGINRYMEPLDAVDLQQEVVRLHPSAEFSDFYNTTLALQTTTRNYILFLVGRDYPNPSLLSGINSAKATGGIVAEVQFTNALISAHSARSFLAYSRNLTIAPNGNSVVTF